MKTTLAGLFPFRLPLRQNSHNGKELLRRSAVDVDTRDHLPNELVRHALQTRADTAHPFVGVRARTARCRWTRQIDRDSHNQKQRVHLRYPTLG